MEGRRVIIDIETYSSTDLKKSGVYKYVEAPDFSITLLAYRFSDEKVVKLVDYACGDATPKELMDALLDPSVLKKASNAAFERICINKFLGIEVPTSQWRCITVKCLTLGLPPSLKAQAEVLELLEGKLDTGTSLITYFCKPCKPSKVNGGRTRNLPEHAPDKWQKFKEYNIRDVEVSAAIDEMLSGYEITEEEEALYTLDQKINDTGVCIDMTLVDKVLEDFEAIKKEVTAEIESVTGLPNANSVPRLKTWIEKKEGRYITSLNKEDVDKLILKAKDPEVKRVLELRRLISKASLKKYSAMQRVACEDGRVRGLLSFYGARTGRWAGRLVQVQNLPRNYDDGEDLQLLRRVVRNGSECDYSLLYEPSTRVDKMSELIRTAFVPEKGRTFVISDFSAIEARVLAWLANETWRQEVFASHGRIYESSASQMFGIPLEEITEGSSYRAKGKVAELALGYQGGVNALKSMGGEKMGLSEQEMAHIVKSWRNSNSNITQLWLTVQQNAIAVSLGEVHTYRKIPYLDFKRIDGNLHITLPSGRDLVYRSVKVTLDKFGRRQLHYKGVGLTGRYEVISTYGGKLVENITQAVARDLLAYSMLNLDKAGYEINMHVHDEVVVSVPTEVAESELPKVEAIMNEAPKWAEGLHLTSVGFLSEYYKK